MTARTDKSLPYQQSDAPLWLLIRIQREYYALPGSVVREIVRWRGFTALPGAPSMLPGMISQRGMVLPVAVPHVLMGLDAPAVDRKSRYALLQHDEIDVALLVDEVLDLVAIHAQSYEAVPSSLAPQRARLLRALTQVHELLVGLIEPAALIAALQE